MDSRPTSAWGQVLRGNDWGAGSGNLWIPVPHLRGDRHSAGMTGRLVVVIVW